MSVEKRFDQPATWVGPFESWSAAEASTPRASAGPRATQSGSLFDSEPWLTRQWEFRESLSSSKGDIWASPLRRNSTLPLLVQGLEELQIVVLGGGSGWVYELLRRASASVAHYVVLDRPEVCEFFSRGEETARRFVNLGEWESMLGQSTSCQVLYCNSSLQYARSNELLLDLCQKLRPRWVLLDDTLVTRSPQDRFAIQMNSDTPETVRTLSVTQLAQEMSSIGFTLAFRSPFVQPGYRNWAETADEEVLPRYPVPESLLYTPRR